MSDPHDSDKALAAAAAVAEVRDGMRIGLGTGSTAAHAIRLVGERVAAGLRIEAVATSLATEAAARAAGIPLLPLEGVDRLELAIDGADEIDGTLRAIKGAGGAMLREKVVAAMAERMIVIADGSKRVVAIGAAKLPVEVLPVARAYVVARLIELGASVSVRDGLTDNGNLILDLQFSAMPDPLGLAMRIEAIPGALGHGLFLTEVDAAYVATDGIVTRLERAGVSD